MVDINMEHTRIIDWSGDEQKRRRARRYAAERRLKFIGAGAITIALSLGSRS